MKDLKVRTKLILCFSAVLLCFAFATAITAIKTFDVTTAVEDVESHAIQNAELTTAILRDTFNFRLAVRNMLLKTQADEFKNEAEKAQSFIQKLNTSAHSLAALDDQIYKQKGSDFIKAIEILTPLTNQLVSDAAAGNLEAAVAVLSKGGPAAASLQELVDYLISYSQERAKEEVEHVHVAAKAGSNALITGFLVASLLSIAGIVLIVRAIVHPLKQLTEEAAHLAEGNISRHIRVDRQDEIGTLQNAFANMSDSLNRVLGEILQVSRSVTHTAHQLGANAEQIRESADTQAGATTAMAAALEEMSTSVDHVASLSHGARDASASAGHKADMGNTGIQKLVSTVQIVSQEMHDSADSAEALGRETQRISSIIDVIKELADQTNLLALNAAIEAARAGEQGRGFAVVADEVRKLAERTTQSTSQINEMVVAIQSSGASMSQRMQKAANVAHEGLDIAESAGVAVQEINNETRQVLQAIDEVSHALREQSQTSHDIARQVESVVGVVENNAQVANGMSSTAGEMQALAQKLNQTVSAFRLRGG